MGNKAAAFCFKHCHGIFGSINHMSIDTKVMPEKRDLIELNLNY